MGIFRTESEDTIIESKNEPIPEVKTDSEIQPISKDDVEGGPTVVLDGPLSSIYTKALRLVLANESMMTTNVMLVSEIGSGKEKEKKDLYVYCCGEDDLLDNNLVETVNKIKVAVDEYDKVIVAVEHNHVVGNRLQLLDEFSGSLGAKVCNTRDNALNVIKQGLKG